MPAPEEPRKGLEQGREKVAPGCLHWIPGDCTGEKRDLGWKEEDDLRGEEFVR